MTQHEPFDDVESLSADMPADLGRLRRSDPPFPAGQTADRHRALIASGYVLRPGVTGATVFRSWDPWR
jgi:hypothetical protein